MGFEINTKSSTNILAIPFGIDIDVVKNVFGSRDEALLMRVQQTKTFKRFDEDLSFKRELHDIIFNYVPKENRQVKQAKFFGLIKGNDGRGLEGEWNDYGHALLSICDCMGHHLSPENNIFYYDKPWWAVNTLLSENNSPLNLDRMVKNIQVFDTPFDNEGISCNYYNKSEVKELFSFLLKIESKINREDDKLVKFYNTLKEGLEYCSKNNYDLIVFSIEEDNLD